MTSALKNTAVGILVLLTAPIGVPLLMLWGVWAITHDLGLQVRERVADWRATR